MTLEQVMKSWASIPDSIVKPILTKENNKWYVQLIEEWPESENDRHHRPSKLFLERLEWMDSTRKQFEGAKRSEYDRWEFGRKFNAEKLIILYMLKWDQ